MLQTTIDGRAAFAICDKMSTVAVSRLVPDKGGIMRMPEAEFDDMLRLVLAWLPVPAAPSALGQGTAPPATPAP
jgi:mRNA interferase MazF